MIRTDTDTVSRFNKVGEKDKNHPVYSDTQIEQVLELALKNTDMNGDGYIDYLEYKISDYKAKKKQEDNLARGLKIDQ
ncbi:unnamed protein product [Diatraea saccharalis]|uniref:EF-hand domain-containing protein n=1 Tax=Diatraea saccharalis TaxID=40085 RepID=A0A9N9R6N6_9NEOP|nr:unnamed protein product [Diatraea saccharalis]